MHQEADADKKLRFRSADTIIDTMKIRSMIRAKATQPHRRKNKTLPRKHKHRGWAYDLGFSCGRSAGVIKNTIIS